MIVRQLFKILFYNLQFLWAVLHIPPFTWHDRRTDRQPNNICLQRATTLFVNIILMAFRGHADRMTDCLSGGLTCYLHDSNVLQYLLLYITHPRPRTSRKKNNFLKIPTKWLNVWGELPNWFFFLINIRIYGHC